MNFPRQVIRRNHIIDINNKKLEDMRGSGCFCHPNILLASLKGQGNEFSVFATVLICVKNHQ